MLVRLTTLSGEPIWINERTIDRIMARHGGGSLIRLSYNDVVDAEVLESPEEIATQILLSR